jgi:TolA-binding protein
MSHHRAIWSLLTLACALIALAAAGGVQAADPSAQADSLSGGVPNHVIVKPGEDPEQISSWKREWRKFNYNTQKMMGLEPNETASRERFANGEQHFREKKYKEAAKEFDDAADRWPDSPLEEDSLFMKAESQFFSDNYSAASDTYGRLLKKFQNSRYLERAVARQFVIARYWEELDRKQNNFILTPNVIDKTQPIFDTQGNAIHAYESVHLNDPTGPLADDAVMAIANIHFLEDRHDDADYYYNLLRTQYPQSEHQKLAHLLGLRAKMRKYQGPHYEGTPVEDSAELVQQINAVFHDLPPDERERLRNAERALRLQKAQRDWETAQYYARTKHFGGARFYYQQIVNEYSDTPFGPQAKEKLAQIAGRPDNPPQRFQWIVNLFRWDWDGEDE